VTAGLLVPSPVTGVCQVCATEHPTDTHGVLLPHQGCPGQGRVSLLITRYTQPGPFAAVVDAGWALLEKQYGGFWAENSGQPIDLDVLRTEDLYHCVLAQTCPQDARDARPANSPFWAHAVWLSGKDHDALDQWADEHGFCPGLMPARWLDSEWADRITAARRAAASEQEA
jgi:hypothetical protein